ncbi:MAG: class I adenylate-forming enzyme family protein [Pseudomonadota bacterium]
MSGYVGMSGPVNPAQEWAVMAAERGSKPALSGDDQTVAWADLALRGARLAALLGGLPAGNVALYVNNAPAVMECWLGASLDGRVPVVVPTRYKAEGLVEMLKAVDTGVLVFHASFAMRIWEIRSTLPAQLAFIQIDDNTEVLLDFADDYERLLREVDTPHEPPGTGTGTARPVLQFSAGVRGPARCRQVDQTRLLEHLGALSTWLGASAAPTTMLACPLSSIAGAWYGALWTLGAGGHLITTTRPFNADHVLALAQQHRASRIVLGGGPHLRDLLRALGFAQRRGDPYALSDLQEIVCTGVAVDDDVALGVVQLLPHVQVVDVWTALEGPVGVRSLTSAAHNAAFFPWPGVEAREGSDGAEVWVAAWEMGADGSCASGDLAVQDGSGLCWRGRVLDRFEIAGKEAYALSIERVLMTHADVTDCLVVRVDAGLVALVAPLDDEEDIPLDALPQLFVEANDVVQPDRFLQVFAIKRGANAKPDYVWASNHAQRFA